MRPKSLGATLFSGLMVFATAISNHALAADASVVSDTRCVIVGMQLSSVANSPQVTKGILMTMYYLGRLDGRLQEVDLQSLIVGELKKMSDADFASAKSRCDTELNAKGNEVTQIGLALGKLPK
jgi:hypothetical protein